MFPTFTTRSTFIALSCALLMSVTPSVEAKQTIKTLFRNPLTGLTVATALAAYYRLNMKDEPDKERLSIEQAVKGLRSPQERKDDLATHIWKIVDHIIIGYPGKRRALYPLGRKIFVDGTERHVTSYYKDGHEVRLIARENIPPYGGLGLFDSYVIQPVLKMFDTLKKVKDADETLAWLEESAGIPAA